MICNNIIQSINKFEDLIDKGNRGDIFSYEERDYMDCFDFAMAQSIITDLGETISLQVAKHILAHYKETMNY